MIEVIPSNSLGRDFICSDIHGHFSLLKTELAQVGFNEKTDRLFSLGDLIDRGDESEQVLEWLAKPWFFAIQGNHERMLINIYEARSESLWLQWMTWGGNWAEDKGMDELEPFYQAFSKLPLAMELNLPNGESVGLVHAELPDVCDWNDIKQLLLKIKSSDVDSMPVIQHMLWSRIQAHLPNSETFFVEPVRNIAQVFHGHTIVENYRTLTNRTFMDLGSYNRGQIGLIDPVSFLKAREEKNNI